MANSGLKNIFIRTSIHPSESFVSSEEIFLSATEATSRPGEDAEDEKTALVTRSLLEPM